MAASTTSQKQMETLLSEFREFKMQYELDMRGENKVDGEKGLINEVRELKEYQKRYPSLLWLLYHRTGQTILIGLGIWLFIYALIIVGLIQFVAAMIGLQIPVV